jgi:hypothetical protein
MTNTPKTFSRYGSTSYKLIASLGMLWHGVGMSYGTTGQPTKVRHE